MSIDPLEDVGQMGSDSDLLHLVRSYHLACQEVERHERTLKEAKAWLQKLLTDDIPDAMRALGVSEFVTEDGEKITLKQIIQGSVPTLAGILRTRDPDKQADMAHRRDEALSWLIANGGSGLIHQLMSIDFGKDPSDNAIKSVTAAAEEVGVHKYSIDERIHPQSLNHFLKEKMGEGVDVPADTFALFTGTQAQIKGAKR